MTLSGKSRADACPHRCNVSQVLEEESAMLSLAADSQSQAPGVSSVVQLEPVTDTQVLDLDADDQPILS